MAPSAIAPAGQVYTPEGPKPYVTPRALALDEIPAIIEQFRNGARLAKEAGFDGVELHGANGYLPDQFLRDATNQRTDAYGGTVENRARFLLEVVAALTEVWGPDRVGVRLSPSGTFNGMKDSDPLATFGYVVRELDRLGIAFLHLIEGGAADIRHGGSLVPTERLRPLFRRALIVNGGYDRLRADAVLGAGGTVGSELVKALSAAGARFRAAYNSPGKVDQARRNGLDAVAIDYAKPETEISVVRAAEVRGLFARSAWRVVACRRTFPPGEASMTRFAISMLVLFLAVGPVFGGTLLVTAARDATLIEHPDGALGNGAGPAFFAGRTNQADNGVRRALVAFDLPPTLTSRSAVRIEGVALILTALPSNPATRELRLHRVLSPWGEGASSSSGGGGAPAATGDATWIHTFFASAFWPHNGGHFDGEPSARVVIADPGVYRIQSERLTRDVALWLTRPETNFGWVLIGDETQRQTARAFASRESADPADRPVLEITYSTAP